MFDVKFEMYEMTCFELNAQFDGEGCMCYNTISISRLIQPGAVFAIVFIIITLSITAFCTTL